MQILIFGERSQFFASHSLQTILFANSLHYILLLIMVNYHAEATCSNKRPHFFYSNNVIGVTMSSRNQAKIVANMSIVPRDAFA